MTVATVTI